MIGFRARIAFLAVTSLGAALLSTGSLGDDALPGNEGQFVHARLIVDGEVATEEWLDLHSGTTRRIDNGEHITVQDGSAIVSWDARFPDDVYVSTVYDPRHPWLWSTSLLLEVKRALASRRARIVRSTATTHTVRFLPESKEGPRDLTWEAEVDRTTLLPREYRGTTGGQTTVARVESERLTTLPPATLKIEPGIGSRPRSSREALTPSQFAARGPWTVRVRQVRFHDLAAVARFPLYTLGRTYEAPRMRLRFGAASIEERRERHWKPQLHLGYVRGPDIYGEDVIELDEEGARREQSIGMCAADPQGRTHPLTIDAGSGCLHLLGKRGRVFTLVLERTLIQGRTSLTKPELLRALRSLRRARSR